MSLTFRTGPDGFAEMKRSLLDELHHTGRVKLTDGGRRLQVSSGHTITWRVGGGPSNQSLGGQGNPCSVAWIIFSSRSVRERVAMSISRAPFSRVASRDCSCRARSRAFSGFLPLGQPSLVKGSRYSRTSCDRLDSYSRAASS